MTNLQQLEQKSNEVLFRCTTVFPFTFFPSSFEVSETKVTIKRGLFFFTYDIVPFLIQDMVAVTLTKSLFFSSVWIEIRFSEQNPEPVHFLWNSDGKKLERIITGLIEAHRNSVELKGMSVNKKAERLEQLGKPSSI